ncbi:hypothetical protein, variant 1 [Aphanomyces astaci]|uniref:Uncharacterized protein n=1 Tax=Aphanomyces astaci TaxID=112090 RepID=W4GCP3_APHAT|nr:hypothetical protein, variant 1 [Aphanomyces astaci]ETV77041.1 hypothetical protein, variant 1 [Aphanomyces astaci]|eukprot:XP_009833348.1 hypothetical protein, variant 1 [Aphanomyces astaci]
MPILWVIMSTAAMALVAHTLAFPMHVLLWLGGFTKLKTMLAYAMHRSIAAVPFLCVAGTRYVYPALFEQLFCLGVKVANPPLAKTLSQIQINYFTWKYVSSVLRYMGYRAVLMVILATGSVVLTPLFGGVFAIVAFSYKVRRMEVVFGLSLVGLYCVPATRSTALDLVRTWFDSRTIARELFAPFVDRQLALKALNLPHLDPHYVGVPMLKWPQHQAVLFGFSYTLSYLMQYAYIGPFVWLLGSVAAGHVTALLLQSHRSACPVK